MLWRRDLRARRPGRALRSLRVRFTCVNGRRCDNNNETTCSRVAPRVTGRKFGGQSFPVKCVSFGSAERAAAPSGTRAHSRLRTGRSRVYVLWTRENSWRITHRGRAFPVGRPRREEKKSRDVARRGHKHWPYRTRIVRFCDVQTSLRQRPKRSNDYESNRALFDAQESPIR